MDDKTEHYIQRGIPAHAIPPKKKAGKSEANRITNSIAEYCKYLQGADCFRVNSQGQYDAKLGKFRKSGSTQGISDCIVMYKGISLYVEVKAGKDRMRQSQKAFKKRIEDCHGIYFVATSFDSFMEQFFRYKTRIDLIAHLIKEVKVG